VAIEVEGSAVDSFVDAMRRELPPLARIDSLLQVPLPLARDSGFEIRRTSGDGEINASIPADSAVCDACLAELFDPANRRYLHPFIACTDCGPRYTMTRRLPYDRDSTSMADFILCETCDAEYRDPGSRRFHAEPTCCPNCGPRFSHPTESVVAAILRGDIVAIKGIGGYHLACDATREDSVARLRQRKRRDGKPFAVMVLNVSSADVFARVDETAARLLSGRERPVVVLPDRGRLTGTLSPGLNTLGLFLPYTGLHYLMFHHLAGAPCGSDWLEQPQPFALVMTSANLSGNPLIVDNEEAHAGLAEIADLVVDHDRDIAARADDSVVRAIGGGSVMIRRARGHALSSIPLRESGPTVLALGAHLKNTVCLARGPQAWLSPHIGDLESPATLAFQQQAAIQLLDTFREQPEALACDWHRDYGSTRLAEQLASDRDVPLLRIQHHHAHIAAVLAAQGHEGPALGIALDGHGLGVNGESWGAELLRLDQGQFQRLGHFAPLAAPGGDAAAREPWRLAAGFLHSLGRNREIAGRFADQAMAAPLADLLARDQCETTTAAGRLFDTAAGLLGLVTHAAFEGEPPMRLEALVREPRALAGGFTLTDGVLDFAPLLAVLADCEDAAQGAEWLHGCLLDALTTWACDAASRTGIDTVALAGGCFLNRWLAQLLPERLSRAGLQPLVAVGIPPNDGSISLGQAWVARQQLAADKPQLEVLN
jgi:hydrogenase maturation protein HypF